MLRALLFLVLFPVLVHGEMPWEIKKPPIVSEAMNACVNLQKGGAIGCDLIYDTKARVWALVVFANAADRAQAFWAGKQIALQLCTVRDTVYVFYDANRVASTYGCNPEHQELKPVPE